MQPLSKYDQIYAVLPFVAAEAERETGKGVYTRCVVHYLEIGQAPLSGQNVVETYNATVDDMVTQWIDYYYQDQPKPEWLEHIEGP